MKCINCGAGNGANDKFCAFCGGKLEEVNASTTESSAAQTLNETSPSKKNRGPVIAVVAVLVLVLGVCSVFGYMYFKSNQMTPEQRLTQGLYKLVEAERGQVRSVIELDQLELDTEASESAMIQDLLQEAVVESVVTYDVDLMQAEAALNLEMMGTSLVTLTIYMDRDTLMLDVPLLYDQALYIQWDALLQMVQGPFIENLIFGSMMDFGVESGVEAMPEASIDTDVIKGAAEIVVAVFNKDQYKSYEQIDRTVYNELMEAYLIEVVHEIEEGSFVAGDVTYEGLVYHMVYDGQATMFVMEDILEEMSEDPQMVLFFEEVVDVFISKVIREKNYILYAALMEDDIEAVTAWKDIFASELEVKKTELVERLMDGFQNAKGEMQGAIDEASSQAGVEVDSAMDSTRMMIDINVDQDGVIRSQEMTIDMDLSTLNEDVTKAVLSVDSVFRYMDEEVTFDGVDVTRSVDVGALNDEELMTLFGEIQTNAMENIMSNPIFSDLFIMGY